MHLYEQLIDTESISSSVNIPLTYTNLVSIRSDGLLSESTQDLLQDDFFFTSSDSDPTQSLDPSLPVSTHLLIDTLSAALFGNDYYR